MNNYLSMYVSGNNAQLWSTTYTYIHTSLYVAIHHGNYAYLSGVYSEIGQYDIILPLMKGGIWWERVHTWLGLYLAPGVPTINHSAKITCVVSQTITRLHWSQLHSLVAILAMLIPWPIYHLYILLLQLPCGSCLVLQLATYCISFLHFFPYLQLPQHLKTQKPIMTDILHHNMINTRNRRGRGARCAHAQISTLPHVVAKDNCVCHIIIPPIRHTLQTQDNCRMRVPRRKLITRSSVQYNRMSYAYTPEMLQLDGSLGIAGFTASTDIPIRNNHGRSTKGLQSYATSEPSQDTYGIAQLSNEH